MAKRLKFTEEEKERRRQFGLPITKQLRYMSLITYGEYKEVGVDNYNYKVVKTLKPSETHIFEINLVTGEKITIMQDFFIHMQKPSFEEDMLREFSEENDDDEGEETNGE